MTLPGDFENGWVDQRKAFFVSVFMLSLLVLPLWSTQSHVMAAEQDVQVSESDNTQAYDQMEAQSGQITEQPQDLADASELEQNLEAFDPSTIPESAPIPDAEYVFEVPVDVKDLSSEVKGLGLHCEIFSWEHHDSWDPDDDRSTKWTWGDARLRLDLVDGSYNGNASIGVNKMQGAARKPDKYEIKIYLIGPDNSWEIPNPSRTDNHWSAVDPDEPFKWKIGPHNLP